MKDRNKCVMSVFYGLACLGLHIARLDVIASGMARLLLTFSTYGVGRGCLRFLQLRHITSDHHTPIPLLRFSSKLSGPTKPFPTGLPLSEAEGEHLSLFSYHSCYSHQNTRTHRHAHAHPRTPAIYPGTHEATSGEPRGLKKEEEGGHKGGLALPACFLKAPQAL